MTQTTWWLGLKSATSRWSFRHAPTEKSPEAAIFTIIKERNVIECMFGKLKYYRRIATRYEKKANHFMGMLFFCATLLWLR